MATKIFIDTNILIDFVDKSRIHHFEAYKLVENASQNNIGFYCSETVITTAYFVLEKAVERNLLQNILLEILNVFTLLHCTNNLVTQALKAKPTDLEDAILYEIAMQNKMDYFVTNDKQALKKLQIATLPVLSSKAMLKQFN
jgi:predicted nucleic acid-binding protein